MIETVRGLGIVGCADARDFAI